MIKANRILKSFLIKLYSASFFCLGGYIACFFMPKIKEDPSYFVLEPNFYIFKMLKKFCFNLV